MKYLFVIERGKDGSFIAYVPDLPGCTSCADTEAELRISNREAVQSHIEMLREYKEPVPPPTSKAELVEAGA